MTCVCKFPSHIVARGQMDPWVPRSSWFGWRWWMKSRPLLRRGHLARWISTRLCWVQHDGSLKGGSSWSFSDTLQSFWFPYVSFGFLKTSWCFWMFWWFGTPLVDPSKSRIELWVIARQLHCETWQKSWNTHTIEEMHPSPVLCGFDLVKMTILKMF